MSELFLLILFSFYIKKKLFQDIILVLKQVKKQELEFRKLDRYTLAGRNKAVLGYSQ